MAEILDTIFALLFFKIVISGFFAILIYYQKIQDKKNLTYYQSEYHRQKEHIKTLQEHQSQLEFQIRQKQNEAALETPKKRKPKKSKEEIENDDLYDYYDFVVVGTTKINENNVSRQSILQKCKRHDPIELRREKMKNYPNAIGIWTQFGRIGYIAEDENEELAEMLDDGQKIRYCHIKKLTGGTPDKPNLGCVIELEIESY